MSKKKPNNEDKHGILYCYMFNENRGSYATIGNNIVHETINFFRSDNNTHYLYIPPDGKLKTEGISYVLITEAFGTHRVRVKYKIKVKNLTDDVVTKDNEDKKIYGSNIEYGNKTLVDIFKNNSGNNCYYANFICEEEWKPKKEITIYDKNCTEAKNQQYIINRVRPESMFIYLYEGDTKKETDYKAVFDIIENEELWEDAQDDFKKIDEVSEHEYKETTFFNVIGKENNELAFSNMFAYFFSANKKLFKEFAKEILQVEFTEEKVDIKREYKNIDIYITDGKKHIIIENKIKSGINGITKDGNGKTRSQLNKYIDIIHNSGVKYDDINCFIFVPNYYNVKTIEDFLNIENSLKEYIPIKYKQILDFYESKADEFNDKDKEYFALFLEAMEKHTRPTDTDIEDRMKARFINRIKELQNQTE